jgi:hypothetical protein
MGFARFQVRFYDLVAIPLSVASEVPAYQKDLVAQFGLAS